MYELTIVGGIKFLTMFLCGPSVLLVQQHVQLITAVKTMSHPVIERYGAIARPEFATLDM